MTTITMTAPPSDHPIWNRVGEHVAIGPDRRDLLADYTRWQSDATTLWLLGTSAPTTLEEQTGRYDAQAAPSETVSFTIWERATCRAIGRAELREYDLRQRSAELWLLIGEPAARQQGFGTDTLRLLLEFAFAHLGLHSLRARIHSGNIGAQRLFQQAGFCPAARYPGALLLQAPDGVGLSRVDALIVDLLVGEWQAAPAHAAAPTTTGR